MLSCCYVATADSDTVIVICAVINDIVSIIIIIITRLDLIFARAHAVYCWLCWTLNLQV